VPILAHSGLGDLPLYVWWVGGKIKTTTFSAKDMFSGSYHMVLFLANPIK
jgi:hypothetical protein